VCQRSVSSHEPNEQANQTGPPTDFPATLRNRSSASGHDQKNRRRSPQAATEPPGRCALPISEASGTSSMAARAAASFALSLSGIASDLLSRLKRER
jgi:hypothetical protein